LRNNQVYLYSKIWLRFSSIDADRGMCLPLARNGSRLDDKVNRIMAIANIPDVVSASANSAGTPTGNRLTPVPGGHWLPGQLSNAALVYRCLQFD
jgi:hypothetical protein